MGNTLRCLMVAPPPMPLGRWSQCGSKRTVDDVLALKVRNKSRRLYFVSHGIDPYIRHLFLKHNLHNNQ